MKLSVVILNYNVRYFLELCLQSVQAALKDIPSEIIVIDNNSMDNSCTMVKAKFPKITLIENQKNVGFSKANNQATKVAKGEYVCILNPDIVVAENTFQNLLQFSEAKTKDLGIVGCRLIDGSGRFLPESKRNFPTVSVAFQKLIGRSKLYYAHKVDEFTNAEVEVLPGALMFLKRSLYEDLKGFDESFFMYGEDIDLSYRAKQLGRKNYYLGTSTVIHFKGESTIKNRTQSKRFYHAMKLFYKKHFKLNFFIGALVNTVTSLAPYIPKFNSSAKRYNKKITFLKPCPSPQWLKKKNLTAINSIEELPKNNYYDVVFDLNSTDFQSAIKQISSTKNKFITYKFFPKKCNYFIGSDFSVRFGEVVHSEKFDSIGYF